MVCYSQDFIDRCKAEYPDWTRLHELLDAGVPFAGRYLDDAQYETIDPAALLNDSNLPVLQKKAKRIIRRRALYAEWIDKYSDCSEEK